MMWSFVAPAKLIRVPTGSVVNARARPGAWHDDASLQSSLGSFTHLTSNYHMHLYFRLQTQVQDGVGKMQEISRTDSEMALESSLEPLSTAKRHGVQIQHDRDCSEG